ncbi:MAG: CBS domain-containing protein [Candidatus Mcinerneyibacterium aminivorans]|uniref:CBS domain-containing protein n=1 Tax=Candidatus Mcinerneyibacterium aminivorans TaxID=2703815 RepID=A0A5D0MBW1_9BACT|nr:MAG: CBS domain-containing protein [Candidatus Mcinerneyibacterium aminivorans]
MRIFISHEGMDFDSLAGMYAAKKLYGGGEICSIGKKRDNVKMFLKLYYKHFPIKKFSYISKKEKIDEVVIVDTRRKSRIGRFSNILDEMNPKIIIWDHHPEGDIRGNENNVDIQVGSVTTLLMEKLYANDISVNPIEANLFLMGIYEDTGSLIYPNTTSRDVEIVSKLLKDGGKLDLVSSYLNRGFNTLQDDLLNRMLSEINTYKIKNYDIAISTIKLKEIVGGISDIVHKVQYMKNYKTIFVIVGMGNKIHMVGRTSLNSININEVMSYFNGGGHVKAGSATIYKQDIQKIKKRLINILKTEIEPILKAKDILSFPVFILNSNEKVKDAVEKIKYLYYMNFPVANNEGKIVGWIPKKKIYDIYDRGDTNIPLKGIMNHDVHFVKKNTPFNELEETFIQSNVSIIIVGNEKRIEGVVTPSDIVAVLHAQ